MVSCPSHPSLHCVPSPLIRASRSPSMLMSGARVFGTVTVISTPDMSHELMCCIVGGISTIFPPEGRGGTSGPTRGLQDQPRSRLPSHSYQLRPLCLLILQIKAEVPRFAQNHLQSGWPGWNQYSRPQDLHPSMGAFWVPGKKTRRNYGISGASRHILSAGGQCSLLCFISGDTDADRAGGVHDTIRVLRLRGRRAHCVCHTQRVLQ